MFPNAFIQYLIHFHCDRDYFECHEVLEEFWKEIEPGNKESVWVGFIQLAVSSYHYRRQNLAGALRTLDKSAAILSLCKEKNEELGLDHFKLMDILKERRDAILAKSPYQGINLPIANDSLRSICTAQCQELGLAWGGQSNLASDCLVNRHSKRDRSQVILEREKALQKRKNK
jgi:predicted metal-dependent hydrolase